jgi:hypothetical protein
VRVNCDTLYHSISRDFTRNKLSAFLTAAIFLFSPVICVAATRIEYPAKFVSGVYRQMTAKLDHSAPNDIYTPHLASLWALEKKESGGEAGRIDFDF